MQRVNSDSRSGTENEYHADPEPEPNVFTLEVRAPTKNEELELKDEDLLLASPILYGYSLTDKIWCTLPLLP